MKMRRRLLLLVALSVSLVTAAQAQKRAFTIEDLYRIKSISDVHVSPDGRSIVYVVSASDLARAKRTSHIWVMDVDGRNARQLTSGDKSSSSPLFSPDGRWIAFISSKDGAANLYVMPAAGGEARQVTKISTGVSDPLWSPDGRWIVYETGVLTQTDLGLAWQATGLAKVQTDGSNMAQILQEASLPTWGR